MLKCLLHRKGAVAAGKATTSRYRATRRKDLAPLALLQAALSSGRALSTVSFTSVASNECGEDGERS
jgi:hypothetical protein